MTHTVSVSKLGASRTHPLFYRMVVNVILLLWALVPAAHAATLNVNTAVDAFDVGGTCSLREAIDSANKNQNLHGCVGSGAYGNDTIVLPQLGAGGAFLLSRIGTDDTDAAGDLDITDSVTINGFSPSNSVIKGNVNDPDGSRHRLMHVIGGTVTLNDLTLRDGLEDNQTAGGGLRTEPGTNTTLNRVVVFANTADGNAGGILNRGAMTINASTVSTNQTRNALNGGGGIFNDANATLSVIDSHVLDNTAKCRSDGSANGGGILNSTNATLTLDNSVLDGNHADGRQPAIATDSGAQGGGLFSNGSATLVQSSVTHNDAFGIVTSGGVAAGLNGLVTVDRCVISFNSAIKTNPIGDAQGGGLATVNGGLLNVRDSVISGNSAEDGGGVYGVGVHIARSTIANNTADKTGGGIAVRDLDMVNSTVIGNQAHDGGGVVGLGVSATDFSSIRSSTIVGNSATGVGSGGGGILASTGTTQLADVVVAGNTAGGQGPDCRADSSGIFASAGHNLIQDTSGCTFPSNGSGDQFNIGAQLAAAGNNGGPTAGSSLGIISGMVTRAPLPTSPLVDAGNPNACRESDGSILTTDQVGHARAIDGPDANATATCDIGAIEFLDPDVLFANGFQ